MGESLATYRLIQRFHLCVDLSIFDLVLILCLMWATSSFEEGNLYDGGNVGLLIPNKILPRVNVK